MCITDKVTDPPEEAYFRTLIHVAADTETIRTANLYKLQTPKVLDGPVLAIRSTTNPGGSFVKLMGVTLKYIRGGSFS